MESEIASSEWVLAIDFGSSNTAAAYRNGDGSIHELRLSTRGSLMPSAVFYTDGRVLVGDTAIQAAATDPDAFESSPKRRLSDRDIFMGNDIVPVTELVAAVLAEVLVRARNIVGGQPARVILTHPDKWGQPMRDMLLSAAADAAIPNAKLVTEAQAAARYYSRSATDIPAGARLAVFDFGAGTCDVAVLDKEADGTFVVAASNGVDGLGGHDLDARVHAWVRQQLQASDPVLLAEIEAPTGVGFRLTLADRIRDAKEALSQTTSASIVVMAGSGTRVLQLTRDEFEGLIDTDIANAVDLTRGVLEEAQQHRPTQQPATIYLAGGSSHIPLVHARLSELGALGVLGDPKTVVCRGALQSVSPPVSPMIAPPPPPPPPPQPLAPPVQAPPRQTTRNRPPRPAAVDPIPAVPVDTVTARRHWPFVTLIAGLVILAVGFVLAVPILYSLGVVLVLAGLIQLVVRIWKLRPSAVRAAAAGPIQAAPDQTYGTQRRRLPITLVLGTVVVVSVVGMAVISGGITVIALIPLAIGLGLVLTGLVQLFVGKAKRQPPSGP